MVQSTKTRATSVVAIRWRINKPNRGGRGKPRSLMRRRAGQVMWWSLELEAVKYRLLY